jgi:hypothetical protein
VASNGSRADGLDCCQCWSSLRLGTGAGFVEQILRQAIEERPELEVYRPWLAAEFRRGLARELADAGRALSRYDAQPWVGQLGLPAVIHHDPRPAGTPFKQRNWPKRCAQG